jgi:hypothetical protein
MQNSQFDRLLKLAKRTGDRLIVTGNEGEEPVVILPLAEYEALVEGSTFFRPKGGAGEDQHYQAAVSRSTQGYEPEPEEDFDPVAIEKQVMAAMIEEEPEIVPVDTRGEESAPVFTPEAAPAAAVETPPSQENPRKPITRRPQAPEEGGEERFYLEAV